MLLTINGTVRAGSDPDLKFLPSGVAVCSVRAVASRNKKLEDGTWETVREQWYTVTAWRKIAEQLANDVVKGQQFHLLGEIYEREYETREGEKRTSVEIEAHAIGAIPPRDQSSTPPTPAGSNSGDPWAPAAEQGARPPWGPASSSDDPPFFVLPERTPFH